MATPTYLSNSRPSSAKPSDHQGTAAEKSGNGKAIPDTTTKKSDAAQKLIPKIDLTQLKSQSN